MKDSGVAREEGEGAMLDGGWDGQLVNKSLMQQHFSSMVRCERTTGSAHTSREMQKGSTGGPQGRCGGSRKVVQEVGRGGTGVQEG